MRGTSFEASPVEGGSAASEDVAVGDLSTDLSEFIGQELSKSDRPELTAAKVGADSSIICSLVNYGQFCSCCESVKH